MKILKSIVVLIICLFFTTAAWAFPWQVDQDHTQIRFEVRHILTGLSGTFTDFKGDIYFDPDTPATGRINFTVSVKSVNTNHGKRDTHLRSKDFFNADKYPEMTFSSSSISKVKDNIYQLEGMLTIKGVTKKIQTQFEFFNPRPHPFAKKMNVGGFVTRFAISRLEYGVGNGKFFKMGVVGDEVDVQIAMEALTEIK